MSTASNGNTFVWGIHVMGAILILKKYTCIHITLLFLCILRWSQLQGKHANTIFPFTFTFYQLHLSLFVILFSASEKVTRLQISSARLIDSTCWWFIAAPSLNLGRNNNQQHAKETFSRFSLQNGWSTFSQNHSWPLIQPSQSFMTPVPERNNCHQAL